MQQRKRKAERPVETEEVVNAKKNKIPNDLKIQECFLTLKKQKMTTNEELKTLILSVKTSIDTNIQELDLKVTGLTTKVDKRLCDVESACKQAVDTANKAEDSVGRLFRACDIRIIGVPFTDQENLRDIFIKIAVAIGYDTSHQLAVPTLFRIKQRVQLTTGGTRVHPTIIAKFGAAIYKNQFFSCYLKKPSIETKDIGWAADGSTRVYINENLTPSNKNILNKAIEKKKEGKFFQVYTSNGLVFARKKKDDQSILLSSVEAIISIVNTA